MDTQYIESVKRYTRIRQVSPKLFYNIFVKGAAAVHRSTADSDSG